MRVAYKDEEPVVGRKVFIASKAMIIENSVSVEHNAVIHGCLIECETIRSFQSNILKYSGKRGKWDATMVGRCLIC